MKVLTVRQPWAWLIIHGGKDIENRDWPTKLRGVFAVHAAKGMTFEEYTDVQAYVWEFAPNLSARIPKPSELVRGAIIGTVTLEDCVTHSPSPWFIGRYGYVLRDPQPLCKPIPAKGQLGFWNVLDAVLEAAKG